MLVPILQAGVPGGIELLLILVLGVVFTVLPLAVSILIYRDAKNRNSDHALAWAAGAFFGGLIVWILYAVVRDEVGPGI